MGGISSALTLSDLEELQQISHFSRKEIKKLYARFTRLDKDHVGTISKHDLLSIPELVMNPLASRLVAMFCNTANDNHVNFRQFVQTLSPLSSASSVEDKIKFAFQIYDVDKDGYISEKDLAKVLELMTGNNLTEDQLNTIASKTIIEADRDGDDKLSLEEFAEVFNHNDMASSMTIKIVNDS